jgi:hypothetical protein
MKKIKIFPALLLTLLFAGVAAFLPSAAMAQSKSTTTAATAVKADPCSTLTISSSGAITSSSKASTKSTIPAQANPAQKSCENGDVLMQVSSQRDYGYRIGDVIPIRITILAGDNVMIDFSSLKQGVLGFTGSDFQLAADDPVVISTQAKDGGTEYIIDLNVQSFVPEPLIDFTVDLAYSTGFVPGTTELDWNVLTTPDFVISTSITTDAGTSYKEGSTSPTGNGSPWLMWPALILGFVLVLLWPARRLLSWLNRVRPGRRLPANEVAWKSLDNTFASAREHGFSDGHYKQISSAVRLYVGATLKGNGKDFETLTRAEVTAQLIGHPQIATISSVLAKCDQALYTKVALSDEENRLLIEEIEILVPRPKR